MRKRMSWLKKTIAMLTLIATVLETGFSSVVPVFASELLSEEETLDTSLNTGDEVLADEGLSDEDMLTDTPSDLIDSGSGTEDIIKDDSDKKPEPGSSDIAKAGTLDVSDSGITGSGYDSVSIYISTANLANADKFQVKFTGPNSASYNPVLNDDLDRTNGGRYDFDNLEGSDFSIHATSEDDVILSYKYNKDGYATIVAESRPADKVLTTKTLTGVDDSAISALSGEGYDSLTVKFDTEDLSGKEGFKFVVESTAAATVDGKDATKGISGLDKSSKSVTVENLNGEKFVAYVVSDKEDAQIKSIAEVASVADGEAVIIVDKYDTKRVYEFEDTKVKVTATLEKADAVPDEAEFTVTEVEPESTEYNYETYMDALNENAEAITGEESEAAQFSAANTMLYDIGFFVTKDGVRTEFEPEEGSVRFEIRFKDQQLAEAESDSAISVVHLPLKDDVKNDVDTTAEATDITKDDVKVEVVNNNNTSVADGTVEFNLNDLSVVAIIDTDHTNNVGTLEADPGEPFTTRELLGNSWTYGITTYNLNFVSGGDAETNFAAKNVNNASCSQTGMTDKAQGSLHSYYIVENFTGQQLKLKDKIDVDVVIPNDSDIESAKKIISQDTEHNTNPHITFQKKGRTNVHNLVNNMIVNAGVAATTLSGRNSVKDQNLGLIANAGKVTLDLTHDPAGTYYFNVDDIPAIRKAFYETGAFTINKNDNQKIVFNFNGTDPVYLKKYNINGNDSVYMANNSSRAGTHIEDIIFNIPNATTVNLSNQAGIFIAPKATVNVTDVGGGWLIADTVNLNCEWHFTNGELPKPGDVNVVLPVEKHFIGGAGNWKGGFKFVLQEIAEGDNWKDIGDPQTIILNGVDSENAKGQFELTFDPTTMWWNDLAWNDARRSEGYTKVHTKWYRVSEDITWDNRDDVEYNIYEKNPWNEAPNTDNWYIHLFVYSDDSHQNMLAVPRTARKDPNGYDYARYGLPCEESRPIIFVNKLKVVDADVKLEGTKEITGYSGDIPSGKFEFSLYDYIGNNTFATTPKVVDGVPQVKKNVGADIKFDKFTLSFSGATHWNNNDRRNATEAYYYFLIKETGCEAPFVADPSQYIAKVTLKRENGELNSYVTYFKFLKNDQGRVVVDVTKAMNNDDSDRFVFKATDFVFTNKYVAKGSTKFYGLKKLAGRTLKEGEFEFTLTGNDRFNTSEAVRNSADGTFSFSEIWYSEEDINEDYTYTITETDGQDSNIVYDLAPRTIKVMIRDDNKDGELEITTDPANTATELKPIKFNNTYNANGDAKFSAKKLFRSKSGSELEAQAEFTFRLAGDKLVKPIEKSVIGTGTVDFFENNKPTVTFTLDDLKNSDDTYSSKEFKYTINEVLPEGATAENNYTVNGITYDPRVYNIKVVVSDNGDGTLKTEYFGAYGHEASTNDKFEIPEFVNEYDVDEISATIGGNKELHGKELERGEFTFVLASANDKTSAAITAGSVVMPVTEVQNGVPESEIADKKEFRFGAITFKAAGKYSFTVTEKPGNEEGMEYSNQLFTVNIEVKDDGKGKLYIASRDVLDSAITFINTKSGDEEVPFFAKKELSGRQLEPRQFTFELRDENGNLLDTQVNDAAGNVAFKHVKYLNNKVPATNDDYLYEVLSLKNPGDKAEFIYTIREVIPKQAKYDENTHKFFLNGYTYDDHVESVPVTVTLQADGSLVADAKNATLTVPAIFNNEYHAKGEIDFDGTKKITGREFKDEDEGKFWADLYDETGKRLQHQPITKDTRVFGLNGGEFKFDKITFTEKDLETTPGNYLTSITREYTVKESADETLYQNGEIEGINMDQTVYTVVVTVTDPGTGVLNVTKQYKVGNTVFDEMQFINEEANGSTIIKARKLLSGTVLDGKTFKFELKDAAGNVIATETNKTGGLIVFNEKNDIDELKYDIDDVANSPFTYTLSEELTDRKGYILDKSIYTVKVELEKVVDENKVATGEIKTNTVYYKSTVFDKKTGEVKVLPESEWIIVDEANVVFENTYEATGDVQIHANKILDGRKLENGQFEFELYDEQGVVVGKASNGNDPEHPDNVNIAVFPKITYTQEDLDAAKSHLYDEDSKLYVKYYTVKEVIPTDAVRQNDGTYKLNGYTYDTGVYSVVVTLKDNGDGTIKTDWYTSRTGESHDVPSTWDIIKDTVKDWFGNGELKHADFTNKYDAEGKLKIGAIKKLTSVAEGEDEVALEPKPGQFEFTLSGKNMAAVTKGIELKDGNYGVVFDEITYTKEGEYEYTLVEVNKGKTIDGIEYDPKTYTIKVVVEDLADGTLKVDAVVTNDVDNTVKTFTNAQKNEKGKYVVTDGLCTIDPVEVVFKNVMRFKPTEINIGGTKEVTGRNLNDGEFWFVMENAAGNAKAYRQAVSNIGGAFTFPMIKYTRNDLEEKDTSGKITYASEKTFDYVIKEITPKNIDQYRDLLPAGTVFEELPGMTYDNREFKTTVKVTNAGGELKAVRTDLSEDANFSNTYDADGNVSFKVRKIAEKTIDKDTEFEFKLTQDNGADIRISTDEMKKELIAIAKVNGAVGTFDAIKYKIEDLDDIGGGKYEKTFNYTVKEVAGTSNAYQYTADYYKIEVKVANYDENGIDKSGNLKEKYVITPVVNGVEQQPLPDNTIILDFENPYIAKGSVDIPGRKEVEGTLPDGTTFTFELQQMVNGAWSEKIVPALAEKVAENGTVLITKDNPKTLPEGDFDYYIEYTQDDIGKTYYYKVDEIGENNPAIVYDPATYFVKVEVNDSKEPGKLDVVRTIRKSEKGTANTFDECAPDGYGKCEFTNTVVEPNSIVFKAHKTLEGKALNGMKFTFEVKGEGITMTAQNNDGGDVRFAPIKYELSDAGKTFNYTITEKAVFPSENIEQVEEKENGYLITHTETVKVERVGTRLEITSSLDGGEFKPLNSDGSAVDIAKFKNKFTDTIPVKFGGRKYLVGFDNRAAGELGKYAFALYEGKYKGDGTDKIVEVNGKKQIRYVEPKSVNDDLSFEFDEIAYDQDEFKDENGLFDPAITSVVKQYTLKEVKKGEDPDVDVEDVPNVTYSTESYLITVTLSYDAKGLIKADVTTANNAGQVVTESAKRLTVLKGLGFTNVADADLIIDGEKTVKGKALGADGTYTFELQDENGNVIRVDKDGRIVTSGGTEQRVTNKGSHFTFYPISYSDADAGHTYKYVVVETAATDGTVIDSTKHVVTVVVSKDANGNIKVDKTVEGGKIEFINTFSAEGETSLPVTKILKNKPLKAGDFTFTLMNEKGEPVSVITNGDAALAKAAKGYEAVSVVTFKDIPEFKFTEESFKDANGNYQLNKEIKKYYTVKESYGNKTRDMGYTIEDTVYAVEITAKLTDKLVDGKANVYKIDVDQKITYKDSTFDAKTGLAALFAKLTGSDGAKALDKIQFTNDYDAVCIVDPPILTKQIMGRNIDRGMFSFNVDSKDGLLSMGELDKTVDKRTVYYVDDQGALVKGESNKGYHRSVRNGYTVTHKETHDPGEISVDDLKYHFTDLLEFEDAKFDLTTGRVEKTFVYTATENKDVVVDGITNSGAVFTLTVTVYDVGDGKLYTIPPTIKEMKWVQQTPNNLTDEQYNDKFLNTDDYKGSIDIVGVKRLNGRELTKDDVFTFTLTDDETGRSVSVNNIEDKSGVPSVVAFNAKDIDFLNYKEGAFETYEDSGVWEAYHQEGEHTYTLVENYSDKAGIVCDTATFKIYVDVKKLVDANGKPILDAHNHGQLTAKVTKVEKLKENTKTAFDFSNNNYFEFTNEFKATGSVEFTGTKIVQGEKDDFDMTGQFGFALYKYDDASRKAGKTFVVEAKTAKDGSFKLTVPAYDQEVLKSESGKYEASKTLYYRIVETKPSEGQWTNNNTVFESNGIVFDNTEYDVDVTITYDGNNALKVTKDIKKAATGEAVTVISFTNIKSIEYTTVPCKKHWMHNGKELTPEQVKSAKVPDLNFNLYSSAVNGGKEVINSYVLKSGELEFTFRTDKAGVDLPKYDTAGKLITYTVEEMPVAGYLSEKNGYDFYNTDGDIKIQKIDADTNEPLTGATLAIYDGKTELDKWTTETSAHVVDKAKGLQAGKTYILRELKAPAGYEIAADVSFTVPSDGSDITVTMKDKPIIGSVKLTKRDRATRETLAGAEFALYDSNNTRIYATGSSGKYTVTSRTSNGVFATDASGVLTVSDLPYGAYYFVETKAPKGYQLSDEKLGFTIADAEKTVEVTYLNTEATGAVRLRKVSASGERSLAGAVFELYSATPRSAAQAVSSTIFSDAYYRYDTYTTNSSGEIYVDNLPWDDYYFIEVKAPDGYEIAKDVTGDPLVYTFRIDESTTGKTIDLGDIVNNPEDEDSGVLGERREPESGVLGVRSKPKGGVLGTRVGPATGDMSSIALWLAAMLACIGTIVWLLIEKRRKRA